jgi:hypothetical protein
MSSELVHGILPVFLVSTLGASVLTVGVIEGVAEASALPIWTTVSSLSAGPIQDFRPVSIGNAF